MPQKDSNLSAILDQLMPMREAAGLTPYSAEYLSLLARQGKLQAFKINRDWMTTRQAVLLYFKKQQLKHQQTIESLERSLKGSSL